MPPAFVLSQDQTLMKDFHELDCSLKFADLFIVVLTTFNCWNQMIPSQFLVCLLCSVFKGLSRCFISNSYIISSSYDICQQNVLKKFFVVLYKRCRVDDLNIISLDLSYCQQEFKIS